jgi:hypothetical protein
LLLNYLYYLCPQEVEEETGSAGEQPDSNKLPALRSNKLIRDNIFGCPLFVTDIALWLRKPISVDVVLCRSKSRSNNLLSVDKLHFPSSIYQGKKVPHSV